MSTVSLITCRGLQVAYGREMVLRGVDLEVVKGSFLPLVGPNGAGKTTLLMAILGLVKPSAGTVETPFARRPPGYVPQQGVIDPLFPVPASQIVAMGLYPHLGWWKKLGKQDRRAVSGVLAMLGMDGQGSKTFAQLSGGMRQKTLIARALVARPEVLILDEPTAGLDEESQQEIMAHLVAINRQQGCTIVMAHHGESLLADAAPLVCQMEHGRVRLREPSHV